MNPTAQVYAQYDGAEQSFFAVEHSAFRDLCRRVFSLDKEFRDDGDSSGATEFLGPARQFAWDHLQIPIPFNNEQSLELINRFESANRNVAELLRPSYADKLKKIGTALVDLSKLDENPMVDCLIELLDDNQPQGLTGLVVHRPHALRFLNELVEQLHEKYGVENSFVALSPNQLKGSDCYESLVVFGQEWVARESQYVLTAPRSKRVYRIGYPWIRFQQSIPTGFTVSQWPEGQWPHTKVGTGGGQGFGSPSAGDSTDEGVSSVGLEDIQPPINVDDIAGRSIPEGETIFADYPVEAQLIELENGSGVWLAVYTEGRKLKKYHALGTTSDSIPEHLELSVPDLTSETYLVLRTAAAGGDYIEHVADLLLGPDEADLCRESQRDWKDRLRCKVESLKISGVVDLLKHRGCTVASAANVRNWLASRTIRLQKDDDFKILLVFLGLSEESAAIYLNRAKKLISYHGKAGHHIRELLLDQVKGMDAEALEAVDELVFDLSSSDEEWGTFAAYRVRKVHDGTQVIAYSQTQMLIELR